MHRRADDSSSDDEHAVFSDEQQRQVHVAQKADELQAARTTAAERLLASSYDTDGDEDADSERR